MRMDEESFDIVMRNGMTINWTLGPVKVELERKRPKNGNRPPEAVEALEIGDSTAGQTKTGTPSSLEVMDYNDASSTLGLARTDRSSVTNANRHN